MTREGEDDIEGGLRKFLDTRKGGSEKIVIEYLKKKKKNKKKNNRKGRGARKKLNR